MRGKIDGSKLVVTLDLWKDFNARSRCIEVLYRPDKEENHEILTKVYFDFDPMVIVMIKSY